MNHGAQTGEPRSVGLRSGRRAFLIAAAVVVGAIGAGVLFVPRVGSKARWVAHKLWQARLSPAGRIKAHFEYLDLDPAGVDTYIEAHTDNQGELRRMDESPSDFFTKYLLSTDFFQNGADENRRLSYVAYYDPHVTACYNPLAVLEQ